MAVVLAAGLAPPVDLESPDLDRDDDRLHRRRGTSAARRPRGSPEALSLYAVGMDLVPDHPGLEPPRRWSSCGAIARPTNDRAGPLRAQPPTESPGPGSAPLRPGLPPGHLQRSCWSSGSCSASVSSGDALRTHQDWHPAGRSGPCSGAPDDLARPLELETRRWRDSGSGSPGALWLLGLVTAFAIPSGVGAAVFLEEYAPPGRFRRVIQLNIANLAGVPSIVYGHPRPGVVRPSLRGQGLAARADPLGRGPDAGPADPAGHRDRHPARRCGRSRGRSDRRPWRWGRRGGRWSATTSCPRRCRAS